MKKFHNQLKPIVLGEIHSEDDEFISRIIFHNKLERPFEVILKDYYFGGDTWVNRFYEYNEAFDFAENSVYEYETGLKSYLQDIYHPHLIQKIIG
jgi:hypothetical protein